MKSSTLSNASLTNGNPCGAVQNFIHAPMKADCRGGDKGENEATENDMNGKPQNEFEGTPSATPACPPAGPS
jgi:hypothetical protein